MVRPGQRDVQWQAGAVDCNAHEQYGRTNMQVDVCVYACVPGPFPATKRPAATSVSAGKRPVLSSAR